MEHDHPPVRYTQLTQSSRPGPRRSGAPRYGLTDADGRAGENASRSPVYDLSSNLFAETAPGCGQRPAVLTEQAFNAI